MSLNINEIELKDEFIDMDYLTNYLFDCSCIIFLVDITNNISYTLAKKYINYIVGVHEQNLKYCKILLVLNKIDLKEENKIDFNDSINFIDDLTGKNISNSENKSNNLIEKFEISALNKINLENLWNKVYTCVNENLNPNLPVIQERLERTQEKMSELMKSDGIINIVLVRCWEIKSFLSLF